MVELPLAKLSLPLVEAAQSRIEEGLMPLARSFLPKVTSNGSHTLRGFCVGCVLCVDHLMCFQMCFHLVHL